MIGQGNPATELFDKKLTDVIIINWDAINTDPVFGSDVAYSFFEHYVPDMDNWVKNGGVVLVESQAAAFIPIQDSYDIFTELKRFRINISSRREYGSRIKVNAKEKHNPLLKGLNECLDLDQANLYEKEWFPQDFAPPTIGSIEYIHGQRKRMYTGWFLSWNHVWRSLFTANGHSIMLFRCVGGTNQKIGAYIVSTMYIASSELLPLIKNILDFSDNAADYAREDAKIRTKISRMGYLLPLAVGIVTLLVVVPISVITRFQISSLAPYLSSLLTGAISGAVSGFVVYGISKWKKKTVA
jgi:hypothetical protein